MATFRYVGGVAPSERYVARIGIGESLANVAFALVFVVLAALAASVGAWRIARGHLAPAGRPPYLRRVWAGSLG